MKQTLYHGSYLAVPAPLTSVGRRELDFGPGFYVTSLREQAERWARRVCVVKDVDTPTLSVYEFDDGLMPEGVNRLQLEHYDSRWLDFVTASRRGEAPWRGYDVIEGGVANDQVIDTVEDYFSGRITAEQAIGQLRFAKPTHQMCILSQPVADRCLRYTGCEALAKEGGRG